MKPHEITASFPVVILYDDFNSVGTAMATYTHLTRDLQREYQPDLSVWCIEDAASAEYSAKANRDMAAAEVIIITVRGDEPFPAAFRHWIRGADGAASAPPHAIVALIGSDDSPGLDADSWNSVLRRAASQIHPEVFVYEMQLEFAQHHWRATEADTQTANRSLGFTRDFDDGQDRALFAATEPASPSTHRFHRGSLDAG